MHSFVLHHYEMFSTGTDVGSSTKNKMTSWCSGNWYSYGGKAHWMLLHSIELMCPSVVMSRHGMAWFSPLFHETLCHMMLIWVTFMWFLTERDRLLKSDTGHVHGFSTSYFPYIIFFPKKYVHQDDQSFYMTSQSTPKFKTENHQAFNGLNPGSDHLLSQNLMVKWKDLKGKPIF